MLSVVPGLQVLGRDRADILGSPIGSMEGISEAIQTKTDQLRLMGDRLHLLHSHDALLLLRHSFSIPKILYILRTAPCFLSASLEAYDNLLRAILSNISNVCLEEDSVWAQASLPVSAGGLGVRRAAQLAPPPFWLLLLAARSWLIRSSLLTCGAPQIRCRIKHSLPGNRVTMRLPHQAQSHIDRRLGTHL